MKISQYLWNILETFGVTPWNKQPEGNNKVATVKTKCGNADIFQPSENQIKVVVRDGTVKSAILCDVHSPFFYPPALDITVRILKEAKPDIIILNGDIIDFFSISKFRKTGRSKDIKKEIEVTRELLKFLRSHFPKTIFIYVEGNHEFFFQNYIFKNAPALSHLEELELSSLLHLSDLRIIFLPRVEEYGTFYLNAFPVVKFCDANDKTIVSVFHGDGIPTRSSTINKARHLISHVCGNAIVGHWHQAHYWEVYDINGFPIRSYTLPALAYPKPHWTMGSWELGFGILETNAVGSFSVEVVKFLPSMHTNELCCQWHGKILSAPIECANEVCQVGKDEAS